MPVYLLSGSWCPLSLALHSLIVPSTPPLRVFHHWLWSLTKSYRSKALEAVVHIHLTATRVCVMDKAIAEPCKSNADIWIFGYGSLIWSQNFAFNRYEIAVLPNYARYFWQGSWEARGSQDLVRRWCFNSNTLVISWLERQNLLMAVQDRTRIGRSRC